MTEALIFPEMLEATYAECFRFMQQLLQQIGFNPIPALPIPQTEDSCSDIFIPKLLSVSASPSVTLGNEEGYVFDVTTAPSQEALGDQLRHFVFFRNRVELRGVMNIPETTNIILWGWRNGIRMMFLSIAYSLHTLDVDAKPFNSDAKLRNLMDAMPDFEPQRSNKYASRASES